MSQNHGPVLSVVDYNAWRKGYMPPTEHALIDQLAYRGARVVTMSDFGADAYWLVMRGRFVTGRKLLAVKRAIEMALDQLAEEEIASGLCASTPSPDKQGSSVTPRAAADGALPNSHD